jgi:NADH-quinone oxidoreductase subunit L
MFLTFHGESRVEPDKEHHLHESPPVMTIPLVVLAIAAVVGGWIGLPDGFLWGDAFARFLSPVVGTYRPLVEGGIPALGLSAVATLFGLTGIFLAWLLYIRMPGLPALIEYRAKALYTLLLEKYYIDELYDLVVTRPLFFISSVVLNQGVDRGLIEGTVGAAATGVEVGGEVVRRTETGNVQHYAFAYLLGAIGIVAYYVYLVIH